MGRWWCGLGVLVVRHNPGAIGRTLGRVSVLEVSASAALTLPAPVTATSPERPGRVIAKTDKVITGFRPSLLVEGVMRHGSVAVECTAARAVRLYVSPSDMPGRATGPFR